MGGELGEFQEGRAGIEQGFDALAREELAAGEVALAGDLAAAEGDLLGMGADFRDLFAHGFGVGGEVCRAGVDGGGEGGHWRGAWGEGREAKGTQRTPRATESTEKTGLSVLSVPPLWSL